MLVGVPKEVKVREYRVGATPALVRMLVDAGHKVLVQTMAGDKIGFTDELYRKAGATIVNTPEEVYKADLIVKVKEPQGSEFPLMRKGQALFCYLHLAADRDLTMHLVEREIVGIAFETVTDYYGRLPLLVPMSEVAGRIAVQAGASALQMFNGGKGLLLGGVPGVRPAKVLVIGGGVSGTEAARMAMGFGADVTIIERRLERLRELDDSWGPRLKTIYSNPVAIEEYVVQADLVIGAVLIPGKKAPKLITEAMIKKMEPGSVFVDVAIDQGGCSETSRPTTHAEPTYLAHDVVHYCVTNMPSACARTSTEALANATTPYVLKLANLGFKKAMQEDKHLLNGLNLYLGKVTNQPVAEDCNFNFTPPEEVL